MIVVVGILVIVAIIVLGSKYQKKRKLEEITSVPAPLNRVRYVKMIYVNPDGEENSTIEPAKVEYCGSPNISSLRYEYHIKIDSELFTNKLYKKSFVLLDANQCVIPNPANCAVSYSDDEKNDSGVIVFKKVC